MPGSGRHARHDRCCSFARNVAMLAAGCAALCAGPADAKDLQALARFVAPAYTAMNFTVVCAAKDREFVAQTSGPRGSALHYAEHVKNEATETLSNDEAMIALKGAADAARYTALRTLRQFDSDNPVVESERIKVWCESEGRQFVRRFVAEHDDNHDALLERLREFQ